MDQQTTLNGHDRADHDGDGGQAFARHFGRVAHDLLRMMELQAQLLDAEMRGVSRRVAQTAAAWTGAMVVLGAALPLGLAGLALGLAELTGMALAWAFLAVALACILSAAGLLFFGWSQLAKCRQGFERSRAECVQNVSAVKQALSRYADRDPTLP